MKRRNFLGNAGLLGAGLVAGPLFAVTTPAAVKKVKVALIGCGGRGTDAVKNFLEACKILGIEATVAAVGDAFKPKALATGKQFGVPEDKCFDGFDAFQKVVAADCDYVLNAAPPAFRPQHLAAAVEAGKHCFIEKPVAVDPVGVRAVIALGETAKSKGLAIVAGTQRRHSLGHLRNKALIDAGAIGEIKGGAVYWNGQVPWTKRRENGESEAHYMARNWLNFSEMSGDHIVEQHVHNLDVAAWFLGRPPVTALGYGGRARRETGNQFDFFSVDFDFGDDVHIHSQCRQLKGAYSREGELFTGSKGVCYGGGKLTGEKPSIAEIKMDTTNAMVQEHIDLLRGVRDSKPLNEAKNVAESTMMGIMGRISAYTGKLVRWRDLMEDEKSEFYNMTCSPSAEDFLKNTVKMPEEKPPVPGTA
ncbi:MAG: Gfo/Idh/MocA family oxidoreductase [Verrucomicrobiota bacterium]